MIPLRDSVRPRTVPLVNYLLIAANFYVFLFHEVGLRAQELNRLFYKYGLVPADVIYVLQKGLPLDLVLPTFITCMFLHGGWVHIIGNMWFLYVFGDNVEDRLGHFRYLLFYLLVGIAGGVAHVLTNPFSDVPVVGASGAVAGVLGAYFVTFRRSRILALVPIFFFLTLMEVPAVIFLAMWFLIQIFNGMASLGGAMNPVAWWAHIGGFIAGMLLVKLLAGPREHLYHRW